MTVDDLRQYAKAKYRNGTGRYSCYCSEILTEAANALEAANDRIDKLKLAIMEWRAVADLLPRSCGWSLDTSTGHPVLVYQQCSVIQDQQAESLFQAIRAAEDLTLEARQGREVDHAD